ncbi:hypothetical protein SCP_0706000 [Sparassis crispa]|uniref:Uncharacterized protein n=1 Tax=Sparassis crispa TaxID=139825 RepID=A0A401GTB0_9APHY|nr:hypothetical protein SCP_0706000 [Sparassis crispa]GBE85413.1 hypothetical protein SCP_0706000 [Sparassis crispa]
MNFRALISGNVKPETKQVESKRGQRYLLALLATTDVRKDEWMALDFAALHALLPNDKEHSQWLCPQPIRSGAGFSHASNQSDIDIISMFPAFETVINQYTAGSVAEYFWSSLEDATESLAAEDTLVIALIGCTPSGTELLMSPSGEYLLNADTLEGYTECAEGRVILIIPYCDPDYWQSEHWSLVVAAEPVTTATGPQTPAAPPDILSVSTPAAVSCNSYRGVFTRLCCGRRDVGRSTVSAGLHPAEKMFVEQAAELSDGRSAANWNLLEWIEQQGAAGSLEPVSSSADLSSPCPSSSYPPGSTPHNISDPSQLLRYIAPTASKELRPPVPLPLTPEQTDQLLLLCRNYCSFEPADFIPECSIWQQCGDCLDGTLSDGVRPWLFRILQGRKARNQLAARIANRLHWVGEGEHPSEHVLPPSILKGLRNRANNHGCHVSSLEMQEYQWWWTGAADWLAKAWESAGCPEVSMQDWEDASA